jgi:valyl-tRNA synthetase
MLHPFLPYVTEEIYQKLPFKETESITISSYPKYNEKEIFTEETTKINNILEFITEFRNKKLELNIGADYKVINKIEDKETTNLIINMLKLNHKLEETTTNTNLVVVKLNDLELDIDFDNSKNLEEELANLTKDKEKLLQSIDRRKKLLSNENYLAKAPSNIVEKEKEDLEKELARLEIINNKLK